ncbi:uncharacterized protein [Argopecten irradians]|uniref:uncharacterized protein isoform X1 n=1 Tax=Argopecten irradians TaxID=31199 RepID=UPI003724C206
MPPKGKKYCCICSNYRGKIVEEKSVTLHRFPTNDRVRRVWIQRCRLIRSDYKESKYNLLCSVHFVGSCGPSVAHTIPSIFPNKTFKTSCLEEVILNEDLDQGKCAKTSVEQPFVESNYPIHHDGENGHDNTFKSSESVLDVSLSLNDYAGLPSPIHKSTYRHQYTQSVIDTRSIGTQTDEVRSPIFSTRSTQTEITKSDGSSQVNLPVLTYEDICSDDQKLLFYTGIPSKDMFEAVFDEIKEDATSRTTRKGGKCSGTSGRPRSLRLIDEFLIVLMRLRLGLLLEDLAARFCISVTTCGDVFNQWIDYLDSQLSFLIMWPSREVVDSNMPQVFKDKFPATRVIIDCTEIRTETPSSLQLKSLMYSDYKSHMTWKSLVGISPDGHVTFISDLWCGSISDKQITKETGLVELCEPGDAIMADKGFTIADLTTPRGVRLIIPPFKKKSVRFSKRDVQQTKDIANVRIHVERQMERIKNFRILQGVMPITMSKRASKVWRLCAKLTNLQPPLVLDK